MITQEELKLIFEYCPETGLWRRLPPLHFNAKEGWWKGTLGTRGYRLIKYKNVYWKAHRLAWLYMTGKWPLGVIDHIDRDTSNNKWSNLRDVTQTENQYNAKSKQNSSGFTGVYKKGNRYIAQLGYKNKRLHLGSFDSAELAYNAYKKAKKTLNDQFN